METQAEKLVFSEQTENPKPDTESLENARRQAKCWAVMFGAGEQTLSLFGAFLKIPSYYFGFLSGIPQLLGPLAQALAANMLERSGNRKKLMLLPIALQSLCFAPLVALCFAPPGTSSSLLFLSIGIAFSILGQFAAPAWTSLIGDLVPAQERSVFFARMSRSVSAIGMVTYSIVGLVLYLSEDQPWIAWIFATSFAVAGIARFFSYIYIHRIEEPVLKLDKNNAFTFYEFIRRARVSNFVQFVLFTGCFHISAFISGPFFLPYFLYELHFEKWQWVVLSNMATFASILTFLLWGRIGERFGHKFTIICSSLTIGTVPLLWMFTTNYYLLLAINTVSGIAWSGFGLSTWNYILEACSPPKRARCVAYYNIIVGSGIFLGSCIGGAVLTYFQNIEQFWGMNIASPFMPVLLLSGSLRLLCCVSLLRMFRELRVERTPSLRNWFMYIFQTRVPFGVRFGVYSVPEQEQMDERDTTEPKDKSAN